MPTSQIGGSAMSQRFAKSGVIIDVLNINDMEKNQRNGLVIIEPPCLFYCGIDASFSKDGPFSYR